MTSIGFGGGEAIEVTMSLEDVRRLLQQALSEGSLVELQDPDGATVIINPQQVKVLQNLADPEAFPPENPNGRLAAST